MSATGGLANWRSLIQRLEKAKTPCDSECILRLSSKRKQGGTPVTHRDAISRIAPTASAAATSGNPAEREKL